MTLLDRPTIRSLIPANSGDTLRVAYTPDSDDAFNFYAWEHGHVSLSGRRARFERDHIVTLNRAAVFGEHDVTNVSSAIYPSLAEQYFILSAGTSVGRGYGPVLVSRNYRSLSDLRGKSVAVGGVTTTGAALALMYCPGARLIECPYDQIADSIIAGQYDAGVMIHEELVFYPKTGLHRVADLGATWCEQTNLPLPVGLNIAHRRLGRALAMEIARTCRDSLQWGLDHFEEAFGFASQFGRGCAAQFVRMFCNDDTRCMPGDVRQALWLLLDRFAALGIATKVNQIEVIDA